MSKNLTFQTFCYRCPTTRGSNIPHTWSSSYTRYDLLNLETITECVCKFHYYKNKEYLTAEISCFVILTNYLNDGLWRQCKFRNECLFPGLRGEGHSFKPGSSLNFSFVKRGAHLGRGALSDNYGITRKVANISFLYKIWNFSNENIEKKGT